MDDCTVVMVQWGRSDYTIRSLKSLSESGYNGHVFVIDAPSTPEHFDAVVAYADTLDLMVVTWQLEKNESIGGNKNKGISRVGTKYILVTDNDMTYEKDWFPKAVELKERSGADILALWAHPHHTWANDICEGVGEMGLAPGNCFFSKGSLYDEFKFDEIPAENYAKTTGEDTLMVWKLRAANKKVYTVKEDLQKHFGRIQSDGGTAVEFR